MIAGAAGADPVQPWPDLLLTAPLGRGWLAQGEAIGRVADDARSSQVEARLHMGHALSRRLTAWVELVRFNIYVPHAANTYENQVVEQLNWAVGAIGTVRLSARTRLEQRFIPNVDQTSWRLREQARALLPIDRKGRINVVGWIEPFVGLNRTSGQTHTLDQLRAFVGVNFPVTARMDLEVGYLNQRIHRPAGTIVNDCMPIVLSVRL